MLPNDQKNSVFLLRAHASHFWLRAFFAPVPIIINSLKNSGKLCSDYFGIVSQLVIPTMHPDDKRDRLCCDAIILIIDTIDKLLIEHIPRYKITPQYRRIFLRTKLKVAVMTALLSFTSAISAMADILSEVEVSKPVRSTDGAVINAAALIERISKISSAEDIPASAPLIRSDRFFSRFIDESIAASCGQISEFTQFAEQHSYEILHLTVNERIMLESCLINVFAFADSNIPVAAPGFYKRLSDDYIDEAVDFGYQCGFRSQIAFARYALIVWLVDPSDLKNRRDLWCISDISSDLNVSKAIIEDSVTLALDHSLYLVALFGEWSDVLKYLAYEDLVLSRREEEQCSEFISDFRTETKMTLNDLLSSSCVSHLTRSKGLGE